MQNEYEGEIQSLDVPHCASLDYPVYMTFYPHSYKLAK